MGWLMNESNSYENIPTYTSFDIFYKGKNHQFNKKDLCKDF